MVHVFPPWRLSVKIERVNNADYGSINHQTLVVIRRGHRVTVTVSPPGADTKSTATCAAGLIVFIRAGDNQQLCAIERSMFPVVDTSAPGYFARCIFSRWLCTMTIPRSRNFIAIRREEMSVRCPTDRTAPAGCWRTSPSVIGSLPPGAAGLCAGFAGAADNRDAILPEWRRNQPATCPQCRGAGWRRHPGIRIERDDDGLARLRGGKPSDTRLSELPKAILLGLLVDKGGQIQAAERLFCRAGDRRRTASTSRCARAQYPGATTSAWRLRGKRSSPRR